LSRVRILFNGAEPISVSLCQEFLETLAPRGLRASVMFPVYGLAEASVAVTFPSPGAGYSTVCVSRDALTVGKAIEFIAKHDPRAVEFIRVGRPVQDCELRLASDDGKVLPANTIGHVLIRGANVSRGYYNDAEATRMAINAEGWLDTGDLGFKCNGDLVITGRAKDILFVSGQNYYPHDIEVVIEKHAGIEEGKVAVCGVRPENGATDDVLAFVLHRGDLADFVATVRNVRKCVSEHIGIGVSHVVPVARMPKTTSGKIQRYLLAEAYRNGAYNEALAALHKLATETAGAGSAAHTEIEKNLKDICDAYLTGRPIGVHDNIFELGTSSLTLAQIYQRIETVYPGQLEVTDFFDYPTIAELARYLEQRLASAHA